jgi:hypothetical protein
MEECVQPVVVPGYPHRTGEHCASTALRNVLAFHGTELSEGMIFGLASGVGFFYLRIPGASPSRMFHGRTISLEADFGRNTGFPLDDRIVADDDAAWRILRAHLDRGAPVMVATDTFHLPYHHTTSHFPGHRCVVVGYDDASETVLIADRKFEEYQRCSFADLRRARNAPDYPMSSQNQYGELGSGSRGDLALGRPLAEAIVLALARNARGMLEPVPDAGLPAEAPIGIPGMRVLGEDLASWKDADDWSWAARFGYQVVVKRGAGGSFFRSLEADFLREAAALVPGLAEAAPAARMDEIAARWRAIARLLEQQSERDDCDPALFEEAGRQVSAVASEEERFFAEALRFCEECGEECGEGRVGAGVPAAGAPASRL